MSVPTLTCSSNSDGKLMLAYSVPNGNGYLRFLICDNFDKSMSYRQIANAGVETVSGDGYGFKGTLDIDQLINGHKYDIILSLLNASYGLVSQSVPLTDVMPASFPPPPAINNIVVSSGNRYNIAINVGAFAGAEITSINLNIYNATQDILKSTNHTSTSFSLDTSTRIAVIDLVAQGDGLLLGNTYNITASTTNAKGFSVISNNQQITIVNAPPPTNLALSLSAVDGSLNATFAPGASSELFDGLKIEYIIEAFWMVNGVEQKYTIDTSDSKLMERPFLVNSLGQPTNGRATTGAYDSSQLISKSFSPLNDTTLKVLKNFSIRFKAKAITSLNASSSGTTAWQTSNVLSQLNISQADLTAIKAKITLTPTGFRGSSSSSDSLRLSASIAPAPAQVQGSSSVPLSELETLVAGAFNRVSFRGRYVQSSASTPITLSAETNSTGANQSFNLLSAAFASSNKLELTMYAQKVDPSSGALIAESAGLVLSNMFPRFASQLLEKDAIISVDSKAVVYFKMSNGNSDSILATLSFKRLGAANSTTKVTALTAPTDASSEKGAGWFKLALDFPTNLSVTQGESIGVILNVYDRWSSVDVLLYTSISDTVVYNSQNYSDLVKQDVGLVDVVFDLEVNPTLPARYANFMGAKKSEFAKFLRQCADNEVVFTLVSDSIVANLLLDGPTDIARQNDALPSPNPLFLRVTSANTVLSLVDTPALNAELDFVLSKQTSSFVKANYCLVKVVRTSPSVYVPGAGSLAVSVSRIENTVTYSSKGVLVYNIIDLATVLNVETRTYALALNVSMNGAASANIKVLGIPVYSADSQIILEQTVTAVTTSGYKVFHFAKACSAFVYAIDTGSSSISLMVAVVAAPGTDAPTANLPSPQYASAYVAPVAPVV